MSSSPRVDSVSLTVQPTHMRTCGQVGEVHLTVPASTVDQIGRAAIPPGSVRMTLSEIPLPELPPVKSFFGRVTQLHYSSASGITAVQKAEAADYLKRSKEHLCALKGLDRSQLVDVLFNFTQQTVSYTYEGTRFRLDLEELKAQDPEFADIMENCHSLIRQTYPRHKGMPSYTPIMGAKGFAEGAKPLIHATSTLNKLQEQNMNPVAAGSHALVLHNEMHPREIEKTHQDLILKRMGTFAGVFSRFSQSIDQKVTTCENAIQNIGEDVRNLPVLKKELEKWQKFQREIQDTDSLAIMANLACLPEELTMDGVANHAQELTSQFRQMYNELMMQEENENVRTWMPKFISHIPLVSRLRGEEKQVQVDYQYLGDFSGLMFGALPPVYGREAYQEHCYRNGIDAKQEGLEDHFFRMALNLYDRAGLNQWIQGMRDQKMGQEVSQMLERAIDAATLATEKAQEELDEIVDTNLQDRWEAFQEYI